MTSPKMNPPPLGPGPFPPEGYPGPPPDPAMVAAMEEAMRTGVGIMPTGQIRVVPSNPQTGEEAHIVYEGNPTGEVPA